MTEINKIIEETERLLAAGTQGDIRPARHDTSWGVESVFAWVGHEMSEPDARLFAAAPTALRALVDEVKRLQEESNERQRRIDLCLEWAARRWCEWGERAISAYIALVGGDPNDDEKRDEY